MKHLLCDSIVSCRVLINKRLYAYNPIHLYCYFVLTMVLYSGFSVYIIRYIHIGSPLQVCRTSLWAFWILRVWVNVYSAAAVLLSSLFMSVRTFNVIASRFELLVVDWPRNLLHMHTIYFKCIIIYLFPLWNVSSMLCLCVMNYVIHNIRMITIHIILKHCQPNNRKKL